MTRIMVGTDQGLHVFDGDGTPGRVDHAGSKVTALGAEYPEVWAVVDGTEIWRSAGGGWDRRGTLEELRANCVADTRAGYVIGTYPGQAAKDEGKTLGLPLHLEARGTYVIGKDAHLQTEL